MQKIIPCLWFNREAEEAVNFYASVFKKTKIKDISRFTKEAAKASGMPEGSIMAISFELNGQEFLALNGGPQFKFSEAISLIINCETQKEVDHYWEKLSAGGEEIQCGWLKDRYGLTWQVVPVILDEMLRDKDSEKSGRVMEAMLKMNKLDIEELKKAYKGKK